MQLVQACLRVGKVPQSNLKHCGGPVKLMQAFLSLWEDGQNHFRHHGGAVQLVQACLCVGKVHKSHLKHCGCPVKLVQAFVSV